MGNSELINELGFFHRSFRTHAASANAIDLTIFMIIMTRGERQHASYRLFDLPYIVAYQVKGPAFTILRVLHAARRWPTDFVSYAKTIESLPTVRSFFCKLLKLGVFIF